LGVLLWFFRALDAEVTNYLLVDLFFLVTGLVCAGVCVVSVALVDGTKKRRNSLPLRVGSGGWLARDLNFLPGAPVVGSMDDWPLSRRGDSLGWTLGCDVMSGSEDA